MIEEFVAKHKLPGYRVKQFDLAYYQQLVESWEELTTWPKELRVELEREMPFSVLEPIRELVSDDGKTIKVLLERRDGTRLEAVLMRFKDGRNSVCVSCMVGCPVGCTFCATGKMGFVANVSAREIVEQVMYFARLLKRELGGDTKNQTINPGMFPSAKATSMIPGFKVDNFPRVTNVVFMGMGEPMLNLGEVWEAVQVMTDQNKLGMGARHVTVSTSGYAPQIRELMELGYRGRLAVSLHAPTQELREKLMPTVAKVYRLTELMKVLDEYAAVTNKRISYEYAMIEGVNDNGQQARQLVGLLKKRLVHVNLIPFNPIVIGLKEKVSRFNPGIGNPGIDARMYRRSSVERIRAFANVLRVGGIERTIRITMGDDIAAACGQLANKS